MGVYVGIEKYAEKNSTLFYFVSTSDFGGVEFYIGIDMNSKIIYFFDSADFSSPLGKIDLSRKDDKMSDSGINSRAVSYVVIKVIRAFKNNEFPDRIDYCA